MKPVLPDIVISIGHSNIKIARFSGPKGNRKLEYKMSVPNGGKIFTDPIMKAQKPLNFKALVAGLSSLRKKARVKKMHDTHLIFSDSFCIQRTIMAGLSTSTAELDETVYHQLKTILPQALENWYIGYKLIGLFAKRNIIYASAALNENMDYLLEASAKAGFNVISMVNRSSDTFNLFHEYMEDPVRQSLNTAVLNMCSTSSSLAVFKNGMLRHVQAIAIGGENFTKTLASGLNISSDSAEKLKRDSVIFLPEESPEQKDVKSYSALLPLMQNLSRSLFSVMENYFQNFNENRIDELIVLGRAADMSNFTTGLQSLLNTKCISGALVFSKIPEINPQGLNKAIVNEYSSLLGSQKRI